MKLRLFIALGLLHLLLVVIGAAELNVSRDTIPGRLVHAYGWLSGSNANYSFFAPAVGSPLRASFHITDPNGNIHVEEAADEDREMSIRLGNMVDAFRDKLGTPEVRRAIAASWSSLVLAKYPSAREVRFVLDEYYIPTMGEFLGGKQMEWVEDYSATFARRGKP